MIDPTNADELLAKMKEAVGKAASTRDVQALTEIWIGRFQSPSEAARELLQLQTLINRACWGTNVRGYICPGYGSDDRIYNFIFSRG